jgi:hypothetical protein
MLHIGVFRFKKLITVRYPDGCVGKIPGLLIKAMIEAHGAILITR